MPPGTEVDWSAVPGNPGGDDMTVGTTEQSTHDVTVTRRRQDRRQGHRNLLTAVTRLIDRREDLSAMRSAFEDALRRALPIRTAQLKDPSSPWSARQDPGGGAESIALDVPGSEPGGPRRARSHVRSRLRARRLGLSDARRRRPRRRAGPRDRAGAPAAGARRAADADSACGATARRRSSGRPPAMQALRSTIERVAATDFTVLLEGESGVGKELVARQIHELSRRRNGPFVAINCAALVETLLEAELFGIEERTATGVRGRRGKFEPADGGTLFLDEVSDLSLSAQAKLLRAIQDLAVERVGGNGTHRVDIRIVAATNRSLVGLVEQQAVSARPLLSPERRRRPVPPLRERRADILELAELLSRAASLDAPAPAVDRRRPTRSSPTTGRATCASSSGSSSASVALAAADVIELDDLPPLVRGDYPTALGPSLQRDDTLRAWASRYARLVLERCHGNKRETVPRARHQLSHAAGVSARPVDAGRASASRFRRWSARTILAHQAPHEAGCLRQERLTRQGGGPPRGRAFAFTEGRAYEAIPQTSQDVDRGPRPARWRRLLPVPWRQSRVGAAQTRLGGHPPCGRRRSANDSAPTRAGRARPTTRSRPVPSA